MVCPEQVLAMGMRGEVSAEGKGANIPAALEMLHLSLVSPRGRREDDM